MSAVVTFSRMDRSRLERKKSCVKTKCNRAYDNELRFHFPSRAFYPKNKVTSKVSLLSLLLVLLFVLALRLLVIVDVLVVKVRREAAKLFCFCRTLKDTPLQSLLQLSSLARLA